MFRSKIFFIFLLFSAIMIFINASRPDDHNVVLPKEPLPKDKSSFAIENIRTKVFPGAKITVEKLVSEKKDFKSYLVSYTVDNLKLYALMSVPSSAKPKNGYPVVMLNHGYIPPKEYSTINSYIRVYSYFASNGFIVFKPDYRGFAGSQEGDSNILTRINYIYDVIYLLNGLNSIPEADTANIFMYGHSMGGDVTLRVLEITDKVKAATLWAPVSAMFPESTLHYFRKSSRNPDQAKILEDYINTNFTKEDLAKMSGLANTNFIKIPLILHHGTADDSVPYEWSLELLKKFKENKVNYKFYSYDGEDHNFAHKSFYVVLQRDADFFKSFLK
jgi:dipeptidyl aminopeptidase/acylaminoacyl peptidase